MAWRNRGIRAHLSGWEWSRIRARVLQRDGYRCQVCGVQATEVDHITNLARGGAVRELSNLRAVCRWCHKRKTAAEAMRAMREPGARAVTRW